LQAVVAATKYIAPSDPLQKTSEEMFVAGPGAGAVKAPVTAEATVVPTRKTEPIARPATHFHRRARRSADSTATSFKSGLITDLLRVLNYSKLFNSHDDDSLPKETFNRSPDNKTSDAGATVVGQPHVRSVEYEPFRAGLRGEGTARNLRAIGIQDRDGASTAIRHPNSISVKGNRHGVLANAEWASRDC
jgi:hypothetical protein